MKPIGYSDYSDFDAPEEPVVMRRIRIRARHQGCSTSNACETALLTAFGWEIYTVDENDKDYGDPMIAGTEDIVYWIEGLDDEYDVTRAAKHGEIGCMNQETFEEMVEWINNNEEEV